MLPIQFDRDRVEFLILSFEGPDQYSQAGGLGVRVANLSQVLADKGFRTHVLFVGDPDLPWHEEQYHGRLQLYRWCQWISKHHPWGVYDGEEGKLNDYTNSMPAFVVEQIARPAIEQHRHLVILAEDWQMAEPLIALSDQLYQAGLRQNTVLLWNANNTTGFERIDWGRLSYIAGISTVSRYMKLLMRPYGLEPLIIPNGIPSDLIEPVESLAVNHIRKVLSANDETVLFKVGRFDPAKCWLMAVEAAAQLRDSGEGISFLMRGGIEPHGFEVIQRARELGLIVKDVNGSPRNWQEALELIHHAYPADIYNLRFFMSQALLRPFYAASDVILANSKHEPFGLVGLEAMAAGGVVFTGPTGESYANGEGAIALDTESAEEIVIQVRSMKETPERMWAIRSAAINIASQFTWENVLEVLFDKIQLSACQQQTQPFLMVPYTARKLTREGQRMPVASRSNRVRTPYPYGGKTPVPEKSSGWYEEIESYR